MAMQLERSSAASGFGRLSTQAPSPLQSEINVTPLVDVMLVLLVIFMLTAPMMTQSLRMDLPQLSEAPAAAPTAAQAIELTMTAEGQWLLQERPTSADELRLYLKNSAQKSPQTELHLRVDQAVAHGQVMQVLDLARQAGIERVGFVGQTSGQGTTQAAP
jgi:biopolymer transport protein ExbD